MSDWQIEDISNCIVHGDYLDNGDGCPHCPSSSGITMVSSIPLANKGGLATIPDFTEPIKPKKKSGGGKRIIRFTIKGEPLPKSRPRFGDGKVRTPKRTKEYEGTVKQITSLAISEPFTTPVFVRAHFYRKNNNKADIDNLCKALLDGMNEIAYTDDKLVRELFADVHYADDNPRVEVTICSVEDVMVSFEFLEIPPRL